MECQTDGNGESVIDSSNNVATVVGRGGAQF